MKNYEPTRDDRTGNGKRDRYGKPRVGVVPIYRVVKKRKVNTQKGQPDQRRGQRSFGRGAQVDDKTLIDALVPRAGALGKRSIGCPDAGAQALGIIFTQIAEKIG